MRSPNGVAVDAILFDLDDTLIDWSTSIHRCASDIVGEDDADRLLAWAAEHTWTRRDDIVVHRNTWKLHELADECWPAALPHLDPADLARAIKVFRDELWVGFFPDVVATLDVLADRVRLGVLSNNPYTPREVSRLRLLDWFEVAVPVPHPVMKPDPAAFAFGCAAMGTAPARTVYVGDSVVADVEGSHAAGLVPVWLDRFGDAWTPSPGVHRITSIAELPALLDLLNS